MHRSRENGKPGTSKTHATGITRVREAQPDADASGPGPVSIIFPRKSLIPAGETLLNGMWSR
ncbi:hypothetical protein ASZ90_015614 [hydrocarbon metagenome]|uniref:Uncharacterized protein n=1 Tax=hydrocarbon metagenome TaxID=938273 RepID=A0A0W8F1G6_9ZZZZ